MHRVVPELIIENFRAGRHSGEFNAVGMFLDLSGFSTMTDALMQHGQHGAEVLAGLMHGVFDPLVESIFNYGGKVVGFAGDGIMALYPIESDAESTALHALTSAYVIQKQFIENPTRQTVYGDFSIYAKIGLGSGSVSWGILCSPNCEQATYYFRGTAVDEAAQAEHHARPGDILLTDSIYGLLQDAVETVPTITYRCFRQLSVDRPEPQPILLPPVDLEIAGRFMPKEVIAHDMRGEFRQVVNLFIRFPDLSDSQLEDMMLKIFELRDKYGGLLSRMDFGDKGCNMLMLWGAPVAFGNDIGRALNFLLDLKSSVEFPITAGVTYYISHAGYLGSSIFEDYTCYGWGVNLASRFMMSAPVGEIWVDDRIARRVSNWFDIEFLNSQSFKGFAAEQKVYVLYRHKPTAEPTYQGELVGREDEFAQLAQFIEPIWENKFAGLLLISGDAGIGKGRLVHEVRASKQFESRKVLWAICQSDQLQRQSLNPLRSWLMRYFGISTGQPAEERSQGFHRKLNELLSSLNDHELAREVDRTRSILGALLEISWPDSLYEQLDPEGRFNNTFLALISLLKAESLRRPVILFMEDLQFVDKDTKDFLARLKRSILADQNSFPLAIIVSSRRQGTSLEKDLIDARVLLRGLSRDALGRLTENLLGGPAAPDVVSLVMDRSEGNPYFAEQILRYLQDESLIEPGNLGWTLSRPLNDSFLPGDVRAVLVARLDQLTLGVRESVQTASVLGRQFEIPLLIQMLRDEEAVRQNVKEAEKAVIWNPLDDIHYLFSHGLLRDAAYEMQMQARRRELHALAVEALEQLYGDAANRYAELAHHSKYAGLNARAQRYYTLAGKTAAQGYQNHQAIEYYKRALAFTPANDPPTQFDLLVERVELFNRIGNRPAQWKDLETLEKLAAQINETSRTAIVHMLIAHYCLAIGDYPSVVDRSKSVLELSHLLEEANTVLDTYRVWPLALLRQGKLEDAMQIARAGRQIAQDSGNLIKEGYILNAMGLIAIEQKDPAIASEYLERALAIASETGHRRLESVTLANLGNFAGYVERNYAAAWEYFEKGYTLSHERGERSAEAASLGSLGWLAGMQGDFLASRSYHERTLRLVREIANPYLEIYTLINLSAITEMEHDAAVTLDYAQTALDLSRRSGDRGGEAWSLLYIGYAHLLFAHFDRGEDAFRESIAIRDELGQTSLMIESLAGLVQALLSKGDDSAAMHQIEMVLSPLLAGDPLEGSEEPLRVYYACFLVLEKVGDPRSLAVLRSATQLLREQVSRLPDDRTRKMYVENVPWRLAIQQIANEKFRDG